MHGIFNGELLPVDDIHIKPNDLGLARGYAVFDFFRVNKNKPVFIEDHLKRLANSAAEVNLPFKWGLVDLESMIMSMVKQNNLPQSGIKIIVTGGYSPDGFSCIEPNLIITQHEIKRPSPDDYTLGVKLITHEYLRDSAEAKTTNYGMALLMQQEVKKHQAFDVLYHFNNKVLETTRSNFFIVSDKKIITSSDQVLQGITRMKVLDIAGNHFEVEKRDVSLDEVRTADEAFITSTIKRVLPVTKIDDFTIGSGKPGLVTQKLMDLFEKFERTYLEFELPMKERHPIGLSK